MRDEEQQGRMDGGRLEQRPNVHGKEQPKVERGVRGEPVGEERERRSEHGMLELEQSMERAQLDELQ